MSTTQLIAHRGVTSRGIENSLPAFRAAVENTAIPIDGVELDVHTTADGKTVVHHDLTLPSGRRINETDLQGVRQERLADGSMLPTLREALEAMPGLRVYVEAKGITPAGDRDLLGSLTDRRWLPHVQVHGFDHRVVARLLAQAPGLRGGVLSSSYPVDPIAQVTAAGASTLWQEVGMVDAELVRRCREAGIALIAWTVRTADERDRLVELGVDGVCADL